MKYTAQLDIDTADAFDGLVRCARRSLGQHVEKIELLRAWILLTADHASLREQVFDEVKAQSRKG